MKVVIDSMAWLPKSDLTETQQQLIKAQLSITPKEYQAGDKGPPQPVILYQETDTHLGVAREFIHTKVKKTLGFLNVELNTVEGARFEGEDRLTFAGKLRAEQEQALLTAKTAFKGGQLGGIIQAACGWGKSCAPSTTCVETKTGRRYRIADLVGKEPWVPSLTEDGKIEGRVSSKIWKCGIKECFKLVLASGQWLEASLDHPVLTPSGYRELRDLQPLDMVAVARSVPGADTSYPMGEAEAGLIGALIADGSLTQSTVRYTKGNRKLVDAVISAASALEDFNGTGSEVFARGAYSINLLGLSSYVRSFGIDVLSKHKRIPDPLFGLADGALAALLRWLFTDGNVYTGSPRKIEIALASEGLIDDIQYLLRRFGVCARKSYKPKKATKGGELHDAWRLQIGDAPTQIAFLEKIGPIPGLEEQCALLYEQAKAVTPNTNWDVAPIDRTNIDQLFKDFPKLKREAQIQVTDGTRSCGRDLFIELAKKYRYTGPVLQMAQADVVWERVASITSIGMQDVYDITVPGTANVVANGLIVHNTVWTCGLIADMNVPTLVVVHKEFLMNQWVERIQQFLPQARVGIARQDTCDFEGKHIVVGMVHSIVKGKMPKAFYDWPGLFIVDETHRIGARSWAPAPTLFRAKHRLGITATPRRKDGTEDVFRYHLGPILFVGQEKRLPPQIKRVFTNFRLVKTPYFNPSLAPESLMLKFLCSNVPRNQKIVELMIQAAKSGRKLLVLSKRINHLERLESMFLKEWKESKAGPPISTGYYIGGMTEEARYKASLTQVIFATAQFASEGLDIPALDTLFLVTPMGDVEQAVGRIQRPYEGKKDPIVVDIRDPSIRMFESYAEARERIYAKLA